MIDRHPHINRRAPMRTILHALLLCAAVVLPAAAQTNIAGTWQGRLEVAPGTSLTIQFVITAEQGGGYSAVVTSPDSGAIKNVRAAGVTFADSRLTLDVPALSGGYAGTLRDGVLEGEWQQEGAKLPLSLRPYETPTLSQAEIDTLTGTWSGMYDANGLKVTIVLRFSVGDDGALRAVLDVPEQGVRDWATASLALDDGRFSVRVPAAATEITGMLEGERIIGNWIQLGNPVPLTLTKGEFAAAATYLDLPSAVRERLAGRWSSALGPFTVNVRFETDADGRMRGYFDIPQQNVVGALITTAALTGTKLEFAVPSFGGTYSGELAGNVATGEWSQTGLPNAVAMTLQRE
jgi:hypothetical protein